MGAIRVRVFLSLMLLATGAAGLAGAAAQAPTVTPVAPVRSFEVLATHPHDTTAFTEGLQYIDGQFFEGTGLEGQSEIRRVDLETGEVLERQKLADDQAFGEGITVLGDNLYQLTWQSETGYVYDPQTFEQLGTFAYEGQGWGLTTDGTSLIMSNGTPEITFRDPETFEVTRSITVTDDGSPITYLNELEYVDGVIWANVWQTNWIARIDAQTGQVIDWLDLTSLVQTARNADQGSRELNGIAWREDTGAMLVTGKNWPLLFEIELTSES